MTQFRWPIPPNIEWLGITGVLIFFTHTCLVLMWSLQRKPHPLDFYIRRAFRIYPAAMVIILITVLFQIPALNYGPATGFQYVHASVWNVIENLLLVQNLRGPLIVGVTWSLPLEMQMYIVLPFLFFFVIRNRAIWPLLLLWALSAVTVLAVLERPKVLSLPFCIPYFLPGVMAYVGYTRWTPRLPSWTFLPGLFLLTGWFLHDPGYYRAWFLCLILGLALPLFKQITWVAGKKITHTIAKYSYGIYLTHTFANYIAIVKLQHYGLPLRLCVDILAIGIFSVALYHAVEKPLIDVGVRVARIAERFYEEHEQYV